jgi:TetR/AcrR family transcriptional regulator, mexJK operon transcriptional repressor
LWYDLLEVIMMPDKDNSPLTGDFPYVPQQERAQQKRDALIESGKRLFIEKGYAQTTAKDIATDAKVAIGTFYRYFSDKRQLLRSLFEEQLEMLIPPEPSWIHGDPEILLAALLEKHYKRLDEIGIHRVLPELLPKDPELSEILIEARRKLHAKFHSSLRQLEEMELTWKDLDLDTVAWSVLMIVENGPQKKEYSGIKINYADIAKVICRIVFPPEILARLQNEKMEE